MGTNYYWTKESNKCECCGRSDLEELHIGKSSGGWCFSLHVDPERGIHDLPDWERIWASGGSISNEYSEAVSIEEMRQIITEREWPHGHLSRHPLRGRDHYNGCTKHGEGTWDCIVGEFS